MKKTFLKAISFIVCILLVLSLMAGCGGNSSQGEKEGQSSASTSASAAEQTTMDVQKNPYEKPVRFSLMYPWSDVITSSDQVTDPNSKHYDKRWKIIMEKFNISIDYVLTDFGAMAEKTRVSLAAGDMTDAALAMTLDTREYHKYVKEGALKPLPKDLYDRFPNIKRNIESVTSKESLLLDGQYSALPRSMDLEGISGDYLNMLIYRKDMAKEAGITIKDEYTVQEIYDMFKAVKAKFPSVTTFSHIWTNQIFQLGVWQYSPYVGAWPGDGVFLNQKTGKYDYAPSLPETVEGLKWFKKFYDDGFIMKDYINVQQYDARAEFAAGKVFCYFDGANIAFLDGIMNGFKKNNPDKKMEDCVDAFLILTPNNEYIVNDWGNRAGDYIFSSKVDDEKFDRMLALYDYLMSDEGIDLSNYGIEGEHYKKEGDKLVSIRKVKNAETGELEPYGGADQVPCVMQVVVPEVGIAYRSPYVNTYVKERVNELFRKRVSAPNVFKAFDSKRALYNSETISKFTLSAADEINRIIIQEKASNVEAAWNKWLKDNEAAYSAVVNELNTNLLK